MRAKVKSVLHFLIAVAHFSFRTGFLVLLMLNLIFGFF